MRRSRFERSLQRYEQVARDEVRSRRRADLSLDRGVGCLQICLQFRRPLSKIGIGEATGPPAPEQRAPADAVGQHWECSLTPTRKFPDHVPRRALQGLKLLADWFVKEPGI